jgi:hypothetical protein
VTNTLRTDWGDVSSVPARNARPEPESLQDRNSEVTDSTKTGHAVALTEAERVDIQRRIDGLAEVSSSTPARHKMGRELAPNHPVEPGAIQAALNGERPKVLLPGDNRPMSDVAAELGEHLADRLYVHNGEIVRVDANTLRLVDAQTFRTLAEASVVCCRQRSSGQGSVQVGATMTTDESRGILKSPQFVGQLRHVDRVNTVRLPTIRKHRKIELLPEGYDEATRTLTVCSVVYDDTLPVDFGVKTLRDLFSEFEFADGDRSLAVAVAGLMGLYVAQLVPNGELRPAFTYTKNAEGAGGTTCAACAIVPVLGYLPTGVKPKDEDEMRKVLTTAVREGRTALLFDNLRGHLASTSLEAFVSAPTWKDRLLGSNESIEGTNNATVFVTANGLTFTPDWRRRSLFVELHLSEERAEDKVFKRLLSTPVLVSMRPKILAACWALVKNWDAKGQPSPSRSHSAFPWWARIVGGIVEAAGFVCPLAPGEVSSVGDEDGAEMRTLVEAMELGKPYTAKELAALCRERESFLNIVGDSEERMDRSGHSTFGKVLARFDRRRVGSRTFLIQGNGKMRRFQTAVDRGNGGNGGNGVSPPKRYTHAHEAGSKTIPTIPTIPASSGDSGTTTLNPSPNNGSTPVSGRVLPPREGDICI